MKKADVVRMNNLLKEWREKEIVDQSRCGDPVKGSVRAGRIKDIAALGRILEEIGNKF